MSNETPGLELSGLSDALNGTIIDGRYVLRTLIARGSMGKVYEAEQRPLGRTVAIKILDVREEQVEGEGFAERFLREASVLAKLSDPNTVRIFDFGIWEGRSYLVMEHIDGQPLSTVVRRQPLPALEAISVAMQVCSSLAEAHKLGVVHRDLKLSNILVIRKEDGGYQAKVIDFGLVKDVDEDRSELTAVGQILGSPMYMAPEQIRAESIDQRADIYALGVVLYRMLLSARPFNQKGTPGLLFAHLNTPPRSFAEANREVKLPPCVEWTVMRCIEKDAADRFESANELRRALKACQLAIEEPTLSALTMDLRDGRTILPPELSDITFSSLIASQSLHSLSASTIARRPAGDGGDMKKIGLILGASLFMTLSAVAIVAVGFLLVRSQPPEPAFVPIQSPTIQADPSGGSATEASAEEPATVEAVAPKPPPVEQPAAVAPKPRPEPVAAPRPAPVESAPAEKPAEEPAAEPEEAPVEQPVEEPAGGDDWEENRASDLVDPWSE